VTLLYLNNFCDILKIVFFKESIIRFAVAIIVSVSIHLLLIALFFINQESPKKPKILPDEKPINLNLANFQPSPQKPTPPMPKPKPIIKPTPKPTPPKPKKEPIKKEIVKKEQPKKEPIKKEPIKKEPIKKEIVKKEPIKKEIVKKEIVKKEPVKKIVKNNPPKKSQTPIQSNPLVDRLYGAEFTSYTPKQKQFINKNLQTIHAITQRVLVLNGYPLEALDLFQEGVNVVSFYLHPDGTISHLVITQSSNSYFLDENTLKVIERAYSQYPLPKEKTKIVFYVNYRIE